MVSSAPREEPQLLMLLSNLESKIACREERLETYKILNSHLEAENHNLFHLDVIKHSRRIIPILRSDIQCKQEDMALEVLRVIGFCLHEQDIVSDLKQKDAVGLIQCLCRCIEEREKSVCTRALWCLSKQCLSAEIINKQVDVILDAVDHVFTKSYSAVVEHEAVNVLIKLLEQIPKKLNESILRWGHHIYSLLSHAAVKVREKAFGVFCTVLPALRRNSNGLISTMVSDIKTRMGAELKALFLSHHEIYVLQVWSLVVQLFGKELHHGVFINQLLPIVELGFKSPLPHVKCEAFEAWQHLIDNFAIDPNIIGDPKRIKLVMEVFRISNAKNEMVAKKKLSVWWHFIRKLDAKILQNFDVNIGDGPKDVTINFPVYACIKHLNFKCRKVHAITGRIINPASLPLSGQSSQKSSFPSLQKKGAELLSHLLRIPSRDLELPYVDTEFEPLSTNSMMGPALFLKQAAVLMSATVELFCTMEIQDNLVLHIWYLLVEHTRKALECSQRSETVEVLSILLWHFETFIISRTADFDIKMKMFRAIMCLPSKLLSSTAYSITSGQKIHGTPVLFLTELLLTPSMLTEGIAQERYVSLFGSLVECGMSRPAEVLEFCQTVVQVLYRNVEHVESREKLWKFWTIVGNPLLDYITKTSEVNQGDALEHNFDCLYTVLMFPVTCIFGSSLPQAKNNKAVLKIWTDLYRKFNSLSALVVNATANICCEDLSHQILEELTNSKSLKTNWIFFEYIVQVCRVIVNNIDFTVNCSSSFVLTSPSKWTKRKQKQLNNLHSFVSLLALLGDTFHHLLSQLDSGKTDKQAQLCLTSLQSSGKELAGILGDLFIHTTDSCIMGCIMEKLSAPVSTFFHSTSKKTNGKIYTPTFLQKLEKLWQDITCCIQSHYSGPYDSDFLAHISPLLGATFLHPRRSIRNQSLLLWNATFSHSSTLTYPENLKPILMKFKEKTAVHLPGWVCSDAPIIEDTPTSQMSQGISQPPEPYFPGLPSSQAVHTSFLHKPLSPMAKKPPAKQEDVKSEPVQRKLTLGDFKDQDFVVILPRKNKRRVLTAHQQEVLEEKRDLLAMYNGLDNSQDITILSEFIPENGQDSSCPPTQPSTITVSSDSEIPANISTEAAEVSLLTNQNVKSVKKVTFLDEQCKTSFGRDSSLEDGDAASNARLIQKDGEVPVVFSKSSQKLALSSPGSSREILESGSKSSHDSANEKSGPKSQEASVWPAFHQRCRSLSQDVISSLAPSKEQGRSPTCSPLDSWLIRPSGSQIGAVDKTSLSINLSIEDTTSNDGKNSSISLVEETQSPFKCYGKEMAKSENIPSVLETPVKSQNFKKSLSPSHLLNVRRLSFVEETGSLPQSALKHFDENAGVQWVPLENESCKKNSDDSDLSDLYNKDNLAAVKAFSEDEVDTSANRSIMVGKLVDCSKTADTKQSLSQLCSVDNVLMDSVQTLEDFHRDDKAFSNSGQEPIPVEQGSGDKPDLFEDSCSTLAGPESGWKAALESDNQKWRAESSSITLSKKELELHDHNYHQGCHPEVTFSDDHSREGWAFPNHGSSEQILIETDVMTVIKVENLMEVGNNGRNSCEKRKRKDLTNALQKQPNLCRAVLRSDKNSKNKLKSEKPKWMFQNKKKTESLKISPVRTRLRSFSRALRTHSISSKMMQVFEEKNTEQKLGNTSRKAKKSQRAGAPVSVDEGASKELKAPGGNCANRQQRNCSEDENSSGSSSSEETRKKPLLRQRSQAGSFPRRFDDSLVYGLKISSSNPQSSRKKPSCHSGMKTLSLRTRAIRTQLKNRPVCGERVYSPEASPSASILKKRYESADNPSPPNKQRRVSFAEPVVKKLKSSDKANESHSRRCLLLSNSKKKEVCSSQSQSSYFSSEESQLNSTEPVCPALVNCCVSVEEILPQLTSSMWSRGLGQLVRARSIHTVGDLSALSERDIHNLPIRSPKVSNARSVLNSFKRQLEAKKNKSCTMMTRRSSYSAQEVSRLESTALDDRSDSCDLGTKDCSANSSLVLEQVESDGSGLENFEKTVSVCTECRSESSPVKSVETVDLDLFVDSVTTGNGEDQSSVTAAAECAQTELSVQGKELSPEKVTDEQASKTSSLSQNADSEDIIPVVSNSEVLLDEIGADSESVHKDLVEKESPSASSDNLIQESMDTVDFDSNEGLRVPDLPSHCSTAVQKELEFLPTLSVLAEKFTADKIRELENCDVYQAHGHLLQLVNAVMSAVMPCSQPTKT